MTELSQTAWLWAAKGSGAVAGSALSLVYLLPNSKREAAARFAAGLIAGLVFGRVVGIAVAQHLGVLGNVGQFELTLSGSAAASVLAWWGLGVISRILGSAGMQARSGSNPERGSK
jgi:hypothetical protein